MKPVADCNLHTYLSKMKANLFPTLRTFFGCLAEAVAYLHFQKIHHMDIKPQNILINEGEIYLADFGAAHDWTGKERSTTWASMPRTISYCPPEVGRDPNAPRNYATDIWSLGVVFLEMVTVLRNGKLKAFRAFLTQHGTKHQFVWGNAPATYKWLEILRQSDAGPECDNEPLSWVKDMLEPVALNRPTARDIKGQITQSSGWCGFCCAAPGTVWEQPQIIPDDQSDDKNVEDNSDDDEDDFDIEQLHLEATTNVLEPEKTRAIDFWIDRTMDAQVEKRTNRRKNSHEEGLAFEVEDDEEEPEGEMDDDDAQDPFKSIGDRLANFEFLEDNAATFASESKSVANRFFDIDDHAENELAFDIEEDDMQSVSSQRTVRVSQNTAEAPPEDLQQLFEELEDSMPSPKFPSPTLLPKLPPIEEETHEADNFLLSTEEGVLTEQSEMINIDAPSGTLKQLAIASESYEVKADEADQNQQTLVQTAIQAPLTLVNLKKFDGIHIPPAKAKKERKRRNWTRHRISAKRYMQEVWEAESSVATSVMTDRARDKLSRIGLTSWMNSSANWLDDNAAQGRAKVVRLLLEKGCNPGTKVLKRTFF